jgi:hypothetical protein
MPILGIIASSISGNLEVGDFESISTVTVGSGGSSQIDFTSIPATFTHLQIRGLYIANNTDFSSVLRLNGSSTANDYSEHTLAGNGAGVEAQNDNSTNPTSMRIIYTQDVTTSPTVFVLDILDYANTNKYKTSRALNGNDQNGSGVVDFASGNWRNTNAITSIQLTAIGSFVQYSQFALYGIRSA